MVEIINFIKSNAGIRLIYFLFSLNLELYNLMFGIIISL